MNLRKCLLWVLAAAATLPAGSGFAQTGGPGVDLPDVSLLLVREPAVQKELDLRDHQKELIAELSADVDEPFFLLRDQVTREGARELHDRLRKFERRLRSVLTREQYRRLDNIVVQWLGYEYFFEKRPARRLDITAAQQKAIREAIADTRRELAELGCSDPAEAPNDVVRDEVIRVRKVCEDTIRNILDAKQRKQWEQLKGEPFDLGKLRPVRPRPPELAGITKWINSDPITLESLRGKVVVVHFWTFGCGNCINNYPHYRKWQEKFAGEDFVMIGVHTPETEAELDTIMVESKAKEAGLKFPIAIDNQAQTWNAWGNAWWPAVYLFDKDGFLRNWWYGELNYQGAEGEKLMTARIEELLKADYKK